jgi:hypothetical protein
MPALSPSGIGRYTLGPDDGQLTVRTGKTGAAAKAGHNLLIEVGAWSAELVLAPDPSQSTVSLSADARSLRVLEGTGGIQALGDEDKDNIRQTIDADVLSGTAITFRSISVTPDGDALTVAGVLLVGGGARASLRSPARRGRCRSRSRSAKLGD